MLVYTPCFDICLHVHSGASVFYHISQSVAGKPLLCTALFQKLLLHFHTCPFVLVSKLLWHLLYTNFVVPEVLMDDRICRSTADVQLVSCISDSNLCILLNQSINITCCLRSGWMAQVVFISVACSATLEPFHPLVHLPLCDTIFSVLC